VEVSFFVGMNPPGLKREIPNRENPD